MKAVVAPFNQEKALVGAFSVITNLRMELFGALVAAVGNCAEMSQGEIMAAPVGAQSGATNWQIAVWPTWLRDTQSVATLGLVANERLCGKLSI